MNELVRLAKKVLEKQRHDSAMGSRPVKSPDRGRPGSLSPRLGQPSGQVVMATESGWVVVRRGETGQLRWVREDLL